MQTSRLGLLVLILGASFLRLCADAPPLPAPAASPAPLPDGLYATFMTTHGEVTAELFPKLAPLAVANFVGLAEGSIPIEGRPAGQPFYDGLTFHRVVDGFVVQGGDPLGTGEGGPGYEFADEFTPKAKHNSIGTLAMANSGPNTNGSQFYFTLNPVNRLNYKHTVFGRVVRGIEVLPQIKQGDVMTRVTITRVGSEASACRPDAASFARLRETTHAIAPRDPALSPLFADSAKLDLPEFYPAWLNDKLHHVSCVRGVTIYVRTLPRLGDGTDSSPASAALRTLHHSLAGDDPRSATLAFSAEDKTWHLWLGDGLIAALRAGPAAAPGSLHETKKRILTGALKQLEEGVPRRSIDAAVTDLIESIDQAESRP